uniref:NADH-ubiquinone oxidoreductase chain 1 n=1 Tax=Pseudocellus gertschi TaxID=1329481 RepID=W5R4L2_9ARAC|nr:NADH dehydrogenase subunit 1 [Pseudocellus gertschi]AGL11943.1 NADH dehydrogenase subunit 1 [Pseudocellus gertschi]
MVFDCVFICVVLLIVVLVGVAFFTLLERKILGYVQLRKGPNSVGPMGLLQPFSDALKLFIKEFVFPIGSNWLMFLFSPVIGFLFSLILWLVFSFDWYWYDFLYALLFFFCVSSFGVYFVVGAGWFSNSKYALLGSYRAVAQMISYEVSMILVIMSLVMFESGYLMFMCVGWMYVYGVGFFFLLVMWLVCCLAETNRSPFDFAEAESELVSGFNIEYGSGGFALIFMSEYGNIMLMSMVSCVFFFGGFFFWFFFLIVFFLWVRGTLPRLRYDKLMMMVWSVYLPCSLNFLLFVVGLL